MISEFDIIKHFEKDNSVMKLTDDKKSLISIDDGKVLCSVKTFTEYARKQLHCDFETIYYDHASLTDVYKCRECGTVIFGGDDERYDPNCCCPTCTGKGYEVCHNTYWTAEEIAQDEDKQKEIHAYEEAQRLSIEYEKRRERRKGLNDWQLWVKKIHGKKYYVEFELGRMGVFGKDPLLKGLNLFISWGKRDEDGFGYTINHFHRIPLSAYAFYIQYVVPYKKDAHPSIKKYYPWQKKPADVEK